MSSQIEIRSLSRLPDHGCLIVPSSLELAEAQALVSKLGNRSIPWLIEESGSIPADLQTFLQQDQFQGAMFSREDPSPADLGVNLKEKITGKNVLIFVPGQATARPGTACRVPTTTLQFLCQLGLPISPLHIFHPAETALPIYADDQSGNSFLTFGQALPVEAISVANYRQSILTASEEAF